MRQLRCRSAWAGQALGSMLALAAGVSLSGGAGPARAESRPPAVTQQQREQIQKLSRAALDTTKESPAVMAAVRELHNLGEPAKAALRDTTRALLGRDRSVLERAASLIGDVSRLAPFSKEVEELRASAVANIAKLAHDETLKIAHENQKKLAAMTATLNTANEVRLAVTEAVGRREELLSLYREAAPASDVNFKEADEAKLREKAEKILGMPVSAAVAIPPFDADNTAGPSDPAQRAVWFYKACRQIEKYNAGVVAAGVVSSEEATDVKFVNVYRESLGILPYEIDARLVQCARRHSKEMVDLKYFSHESPTAAEKDFSMREHNAGYDHPSAENIAAGVAGGEEVFWLWFDSPGHHKNMAGAGSTALGVGRWQMDWTQNMGRGPRLMFLSEADRKGVEVKGAILAADTAGASGTGGGKRGR